MNKKKRSKKRVPAAPATGGLERALVVAEKTAGDAKVRLRTAKASVKQARKQFRKAKREVKRLKKRVGAKPRTPERAARKSQKRRHRSTAAPKVVRSAAPQVAAESSSTSVVPSKRTPTKLSSPRRATRRVTTKARRTRRSPSTAATHTDRAVKAKGLVAGKSATRRPVSRNAPESKSIAKKPLVLRSRKAPAAVAALALPEPAASSPGASAPEVRDTSPEV